MTQSELIRKAEEERAEGRRVAKAKERAANVLDFLSFGAFLGGCWMVCVWHRSGSWTDALATIAIIGLLFLMTRAADILREEVTIYKTGLTIIRATGETTATYEAGLALTKGVREGIAMQEEVEDK